MSKTIFKEIDDQNTGILEETLLDSYMPEKVANGEIALTYAGKIAVRRKDGSYVIYNKEANKIENQLNLVINSDVISKFIYLMPTQKVVAGDIVKIKETYYYVVSEDSNKLKAINLSTGTNSSLTTEINIITGTTTYKKVVNLIENGFGSTDNSTMNPMMLLAMGGDMDMSTLMLMQSMGGNSNGFNPMMLLALKDSGNKDLVSLMAMSSMIGGQNPFLGQQNTNNAE